MIRLIGTGGSSTRFDRPMLHRMGILDPSVLALIVLSGFVSLGGLAFLCVIADVLARRAAIEQLRDEVAQRRRLQIEEAHRLRDRRNARRNRFRQDAKPDTASQPADEDETLPAAA